MKYAIIIYLILFFSKVLNNIIEDYLSTKYLYYQNNYKGFDIKIGILDSGYNFNDENIENNNCNIKKQKNFSNDNDTIDYNNHGVFITNLICNSEIGISPNSEIYIYKVFNKNLETNIEWIISAIKEAIKDKINILNFSFGGINFNNINLINIIKEATFKHNIIIINSSGNDGPSFGTITFPGNLNEVITVGSVDKKLFKILKSSSRGPGIYNKYTINFKPNTFCLGEDIKININGKENIKSGSSFATAIVTGFIALLISKNKDLFNVAKIIELIYLSNIKLEETNFFEKLSGLFNPQGILGLVLNNQINNDKIFIFNYNLNRNENEKSFYEFYNTKLDEKIPLIIINPNKNNIINHKIDNKNNNKFLSYSYEIIKKSNNKENIIKQCLNISIDFNNLIENFNSSYTNLIYLNIKLNNLNNNQCNFYKNSIDLKFTFKILNLNNFYLFFSFDYIPKPKRYKRILIDNYHNLIFPFDGNVIKDNLIYDKYDYDWNFENINTNYYNLAKELKKEGFYIEENFNKLNNIQLENYIIFIIIDNEKNFDLNEFNYLKEKFENNNLNILIISEWNNKLISDYFFNIFNKNLLPFKSNTKEIYPGSNIENLNYFLLKYNIALSKNSLSGNIINFNNNNNKNLIIKSGNSISLFPKDGILYGGNLNNDENYVEYNENNVLERAVIGLYENKLNENFGRIGIYTDSYCLDDYQLGDNLENENCFWLIKSMIDYLIYGEYTINELNIRNMKHLEKIYYNKENIFYQEINNTNNNINNNNNNNNINYNIYEYFFNNNFNNYTNIIPNNLNQKKYNNFISLSEIMKIILLLFIPLLFVLFCCLIIIKIKINKNRRMRRNALKSLGELKPLSLIRKEKKRLYSVSSESSLVDIEISVNNNIYE